MIAFKESRNNLKQSLLVSPMPKLVD